MKPAEHPTITLARRRGLDRLPAPGPLSAASLREVCLESGADDVGFVALDRPEVADQRAEILALLPRARTLVALVVRMNRDDIRTPARSVANLEFHRAGDEVNEAARRIVRHLEERGFRAVNPAMGFPMEMDRWPGRIFTLSHKPIAVAAGLGRMGIHRNVIHPRFGSFVLLGTVVTDAEVGAESRPLDYNPCLECRLCVAACPTGAIHADGSFDFSACYTHNYREFMGGFSDWVEGIADSRSGLDYRRRTSDAETVSWWQSLSFGASYKAAYCLAVCPAGEEVVGPWLGDRKRHLDEVVRPLQEKAEPVYVKAGSDAEAHVARRFPAKRARTVGNGFRAPTIAAFLESLPLGFQRGRSAGIDATFHFVFTGDETAEATIVIRDGRLEIRRGLDGRADLRVTADARTWLRFVAKEVGLLRALITRRIRMRGSPRRLMEFARCFPS